MKKLIIIILLLSLVILGYLWWQPNTKEKSLTAIDVKYTTKSEIKDLETTIIEKQIKIKEPHSNFNIQDTGEEFTDTIKHTQTLSPFSEEDMDDMKLYIKPLKDVEPLYAISMEKHIISNSKVGDTIVLPSIDGNEYEMIIKNKSISVTGNISIHGDYMENGITYHSVLTEGKHASFISMITPTGTYEINLMNGKGYIYSSSDIENKKIDYTKSDTIEVP